jgi:hypothetical protein
LTDNEAVTAGVDIPAEADQSEKTERLALRARGRRGNPTRFSVFRVFMGVLVGSMLGLLLNLGSWGYSYYATPLAERAFHPQHALLKPSGSIGHLLGSAGGLMMLFTFVYSLRKRWPLLQKIGGQAQWLQLHIFLGLSGPTLVAFHTTGKLRGVAAIAFYSMMAMVVSGIVGRYLYSKIPRTKKGSEMSYRQMEDQLAAWVEELEAERQKDDILEAIENYLAGIRKGSGGLLRTLFYSISDDLAAPVNFYRAWRITRKLHTSFRRRLQVTRLILKQRRLLKHLALLDASQKLFSFWHIFHKPFTVLASVVIFVHIAVATYFGYGVRW